MRWKDLRDYADQLEELGELVRVSGASWEAEIGVISELMNEVGGPALLFDDIPGYPKGFRVAANMSRGPERFAIAFGLNYLRPLEELTEEWRALSQTYRVVPPQDVSTGPVFENTMAGADVDLLRFPAPKWHESDGNRYIGTGVCVINRDPDTGFVNAGSYRVAIHDKTTCTVFMEAHRHGDAIRQKHWARGEKCPIVITVGQDPILTSLAGGHPFMCKDGESEFAVAGYFQGDAYRMVNGPVTGIPIPATAEIAIEGFMPAPDEALAPEGPFGEWTGYYAHGRRPETIVEVAAVHYRNDPIIFGSPPLRPIHPYREVGSIDVAAKAKLMQAGIHGVQAVVQLMRPGFRVVSLKQMYEGHVDDVVRALEPGGDQYSGHHILVVVDDDIDPADTTEVLWAMASRVIPQSGVSVIPGTAYWQLDPRIPPGQRSDPSKGEGRRPYQAHNLVINACRPYAWREEFPPVNMNSREARSRIQDKWKWLFDAARSSRPEPIPS
jgi:UbiD family decarboxylase